MDRPHIAIIDADLTNVCDQGDPAGFIRLKGQLLLILSIYFFLFGCSHLPSDVKERDILVTIYGAQREQVKIFCNDTLVLDKRIPVASEYGYSMWFNLLRTNEKMRLVIVRRGKASTFVINPQHFGDVNVCFDIYGGVRIEDASKVPLRM